jgi:hypothetical protein
MISRMKDWLGLTAALRETTSAHAPEWTDSNDADPGVAMLELLAFLSEGLLIYRGVVPGGAAAASRIVAALDAYEEPATRPPHPGVHHVTLLGDGTMQMEAGVAQHEHWCGTKRPRYFAGRMLTADDLTEEQAYHRDKHRRHLQSLHGFGIVSGLNVAVGTDGETLTIEPGLAIDPFGRELCVAKPIAFTVPAGSGTPSVVALEYIERLVDPVPAMIDDVTEPSRIEEGCRVIIAPSGEGGVALSRIVRESGSWEVDGSFVPPRAR